MMQRNAAQQQFSNAPNQAGNHANDPRMANQPGANMQGQHPNMQQMTQHQAAMQGINQQMMRPGQQPMTEAQKSALLK